MSKKTKVGTSKEAAAQRRALFIEAYVANGGNATRAAITAGYSARTAYSQGGRLLKDVEVQSVIEQRKSTALTKAEEATGVTIERTLRELARIAYADPRRWYHPDGTLKAIPEMDDEAAAAIASVEVDEIKAGGKVIGFTKKIKHWDKNAAIEKAMKHLGLFEKDNRQQPHHQTNLQVVFVAPRERAAA